MENMINNKENNPRKRTARTAGIWYISFIVGSILAQAFAKIGFGTVAEITGVMASNRLGFRIGFVISMFSAMCFFLAAWYLYILLNPVNKNIALLFLLLNLGGVVVQCCNVINLIAGMAFWYEGQSQMAGMYVNLYDSGFNLSQIFYGAWVFPLGYLISKSSFMPKILGVLLMIDCFAILLYFLQFFFFPEITVFAYPLYAISALAEFSLTGWLLIKGVSR